MPNSSRKIAPPQSPPTLPKLIVSREEAQKKLQGHIEKGRVLAQREIRSDAEMDEAKAERNKWRHRAVILLSTLFDAPSFAAGYERKTEIHVGDPVSLEDRKNHSKDLLNNWLIKELESIYECLDLMQESLEVNEQAVAGITGLSLLHTDIYNKCQDLYESGQYVEAVEKGFKVVRDRLRDLTGYETGSEAFGKSKLHIKGAAAVNVDKDFNEGVKFLTMAIDKFRNEKSHTSIAKIADPNKAYEYLTISSLAMHLLDQAEILQN